ncbi:MAG: hypothetical protein LAT84_10145 [Balneolia bacterium]|nr:hypothetical protein [Balneolia bacterium]
MSAFGDLNRINTNIQSLNARFNLNRVNKALGQNLLSLSTGLKINRAEDNAAGLSIANKLRSRVAGLEQAMNNVGDARSVLNIAESGFDQVMERLIEMKTLATRASTDSLGSTERGFIGKQIAAIGKDINDIANQTVYQDFQLLNGNNGSFSGALSLTFQAGERASSTINTQLDALNISQLFSGSQAVVGPEPVGQVSDVTTLNPSGTSTPGVYSFDLSIGDVTSGSIQIAGATYTFGVFNDFNNLFVLQDAINAEGTYSAVYNNLNGRFTLTENTPSASDISINDISVNLTDGSGNPTGGVSNFSLDQQSAPVTSADAGVYAIDITSAFQDGETFSVAGSNYVMGTDFTGATAVEQAASLAQVISFAGHTISSDGNSIIFTESGTPDGVDPTIETSTAGFESGQGSMDLSSFDANAYRNFISYIDRAISGMSRRFNAIGIAQNSLNIREVTLSRSISANSSAISRIMDADFAKAQSESIRLQILQQTSISALAQANFAPQAVLGFLR